MKWRVVPLLCGSIGVAVIIVGCAWGYQRYALYREGVTTQGHVVEIRADWRKDDEGRMRAYSYPVIEFRSSVEKQHRFTGDNTAFDSFEAGESVNVLYDPRNPGDARIVSFVQFWLGPVAVGVFGFLFLAGGVGAFFMIRSIDMVTRKTGRL